MNLLILCTLTVLLLVSGCAAKSGAAEDKPSSTGGATVTAGATATEAGSKTFTIDELKKFDGQNGNKAYVAVDGVVYDVTDIPKWANGQHNGLTAGNDLTEAIAASPHGKAILGKLTVVGKLKSE